jgi:hypothetical protein
MSTKFYLAGPMTGIPFANIPAFDEAADDLRSRGHDVTSPAELDSREIRERSLQDPTGTVFSGSWGEFLARDVKLIADELNAVVVLPGWERSRGANLEVYVALTLGYPLFRYAPEEKDGLVPMTYEEAFHGILVRNKIKHFTDNFGYLPAREA